MESTKLCPSTHNQLIQTNNNNLFYSRRRLYQNFDLWDITCVRQYEAKFSFREILVYLFQYQFMNVSSLDNRTFTY